MTDSNIRFSCPHCSGHSEAGADLAGAEVECPHCGKVISILPLPAPVATATATSPVPPTVPERHTFAVSYKSDDQPHSLKGTVTLDGTTVILAGTKRRLFRSRKTQLDMPLATIVNVTREKKVVRFETRTTDDSGKEVARGCVLSMKSKDEAETLARLLPDTITPDVERLMAETTAFQALLRSATRFAFLTPVLMAANIAVFVFMVVKGVNPIEPTIEQLLVWGANFGPLTLSGQYWRLLSCAFIHIGIVHLALNMWVLYSIGSLVERLFGNVHFILVYLATGLLASMTSLVWNPETVSAGASGAIFGVYGALAAALFKQRGEIPPLILRSIRSSTVGFVAYNVIYGFMNPGIDNAAHVGGLVSGLIVGFVVARPMEPVARRKLFWPRLKYLSIAALLLAVGMSFALPRYYGHFSRFLDSYVEKEELALSWFANLTTQYDNGQLDDASFSNQLERQILPTWQSLVEQGSDLDLPSDTLSSQQHACLLKVASLRRDALLALIDGMRNNKPEQVQRFTELEAKVAAIIQEFSAQAQ
jgi:rhomboid protease GluP